MRGDLTVFKNDITLGLTVATKFVLDGDRIAGTSITGTSEVGVFKRDSEKSFRVSLNAASVEAAGGEGPIRFAMGLERNEEGFRVYRIVPANGKPAHGKITTRI